MSNPVGGYGPTQIPFVDGVTPVQAWAAIPDSGISVTFDNQDLTNTVFVGTSSNITIGGSNTAAIPALTALVLDGGQTWYVVAAAGTADLQVIPGGSSQSSSPVAVAEAIVAAGLATEIAAAISQTGLPLIGPPNMLYNISGVPPAAGAGLVGFTIPNSALVQSGCYDTGKTQAQADTQMVGILGRGNNGHPFFTKKFWTTPSDFTLPKNDMANYASFGTAVACAVKPSFTTGFPANTNFRTTGTAAQKAQANTDYAAITTFFNTLLGAPYNFTAAQLRCVLWQEPEVMSNSMTTTDYQNVLFTYASAIPAGIILVVDIGSARGAAIATSYANAAVASGVTIGAFAQDYYMPQFLQGITLDAVASVANAAGKPFGIYEFGCAPNNFSPNGITDSQSYFSYLTSYMQGRLQANLVNADCEYYMGICGANGAGDLTSPIGLDPTVSQPDPRIAMYQSFYDTLTSQPSSAFTIPATSTAVLPPLAPSPVGGLAPSENLSYEVAFGLSAGVGATNPFAAVTFEWYDFDQVPKIQTPVFKEVWHVPMGANADPNGPLVVYGTGRMHGAFLVVKINNQDTVTATLTFFQFAGTARTGARSNLTWYPNSGVSPAVPGFTLAQAVDQGLQIGRESGVVIAAGNTNKYLCGLFAGQAFLRIFASGTAPDVNFTLQPQPVGTFGTENLINESITTNGGEQLLTIALPRAPCLMTINNGGPNSATVDFQLIGIETG